MNAPENKIVGRVQALLAKAESTEFPEEAEALIAKAQELMTRHSIDEAVAQQRRAAGTKPSMRKLRVEAPYARAKVTLLTQIGHTNLVQVVFNDNYVATLFGFDADLDNVELMFASLLVQATSEMVRTYSDDVGAQKAAFRRAFLVAYARRIGQRLQEARAAAEAAAETELGMALVPMMEARRAAIDERVAEEFPQLRTSYSRISHAAGYRAGTAAADRADLGGQGRIGGQGRTALTR